MGTDDQYPRKARNSGDVGARPGKPILYGRPGGPETLKYLVVVMGGTSTAEGLTASIIFSCRAKTSLYPIFDWVVHGGDS
jgi:hypothetical protein